MTGDNHACRKIYLTPAIPNSNYGSKRIATARNGSSLAKTKVRFALFDAPEQLDDDEVAEQYLKAA